MFEKLPVSERIARAKSKMRRIIDNFLFLLDLHANNALVVYSPTLSSQIPTSHAANAFLVFQKAMHHYEIVRLCALWDSADLEKENIPTVIELIDTPEIIEALADETRRHWVGMGGTVYRSPRESELDAIEHDKMLREENVRFGNEQGARAVAELRAAIMDARAIVDSSRLRSVMNLRDKNLAHSLETTRREAKHGPIAPMKYGDETALLDSSVPIIERLYCWVNGTSFSIADSRKIDSANAEALWQGCKFTVLH